MFNIIRERRRQGFRTFPFPSEKPALPDRFRGLPVLEAQKCPEGCVLCVESCPTAAISAGPGTLTVDLGRCLFCTDCLEACPHGAIEFKPEYRLSVRGRQDLVIGGNKTLKLAERLDGHARRLLGRSLKLRQVCAAGCNGCEADVNVLNTLVFDLSRFGIQFVASPRHADGLLITGPVSENMREALRIAYDATPGPKIVIAVGACAISGGPFRDHEEQCNGTDSFVPVDLYIPGCPPQPWTVLDGLLRILDKLTDKTR